MVTQSRLGDMEAHSGRIHPRELVGAAFHMYLPALKCQTADSPRRPPTHLTHGHITESTSPLHLTGTFILRIEALCARIEHCGGLAVIPPMKLREPYRAHVGVFSDQEKPAQWGAGVSPGDQGVGLRLGLIGGFTGNSDAQANDEHAHDGA